MSRVLAVLAAIALIVGAVVLRGVLDDDGGRGPSSGGDPIDVVCAEEMRAACEALDLGSHFEITIEDAAATADELVGADAHDAWVVSYPWPSIVDDARVRAGRDALFQRKAVTLAATRIGVVGPAELDGCDWRCIGERAADGVQLGSRSLSSSGVGVLTLATAAAGWFGGPTFATNDFDADFERWLSGLAGAIEPSESPVRQLLQSRAFFDAALTYEAEAAPALAAAAEDRKAGLTLLYPAPVVTLDAQVVLGPVPSDADADELTTALAAALVETGWSAPATSAATGLPGPGVITALRERVR